MKLLSYLRLSLFPFVLLGASVVNPAQPSQNQSTVQKAKAILEKHCAKCHGATNAPNLNLFDLNDRKGFIQKNQIKPGDSKNSRVYVRAALSPDDPMPPNSEKNSVSKAEANILKVWIEEGAREPATERSGAGRALPEGKFITEKQMLETIARDLEMTNPRERKFYRYFTLTHLANSGATSTELKSYRVGFSKLINSLSWQRLITIPSSIDSIGGGTIIRVDLRKYVRAGQEETIWKRLLAAYPYFVRSETDLAKTIYSQTYCDLPYVRADWFVANAALPPLYHDLLDLPLKASELEDQLKVNVKGNIENETARRSGFDESGVSANNRVVERHESAYGAYWRSYDFSANSGKQNIKKNPLSFVEAGGEIIFNLPNGMQAYMLVNARGGRIDTGPIDIVNNKENPSDPVVRNGLTCMSCHAQGMKPFDDRSDEVRNVILATKIGNKDFDRDKALAIYAPKAEMKRLTDSDARAFANAVRATGTEVRTEEPVVALAAKFKRSLTREQAAAEIGLTESEFKRRIASNDKVGSLLISFKTDSGRLKRDAWEEYLGDIVKELDLGAYQKPIVLIPPIQTGKPTGNQIVRNNKTITITLEPGVTMDLALSPSGNCKRGDSDQRDNPRRTVNVDAFFMQTTPVTVAQYRAYCKDRGLSMPLEPVYRGFNFNPGWTKTDHPIVNVNFDEVNEFCIWVSEKCGKNIRLPREEEWEKAARGTNGRKYAWGNDDPTADNVGKLMWSSMWSAKNRTNSVAQFPANEFGLFDMAGNVWQWCNSLYESGKNHRVDRGGCWGDPIPRDFRASCRGHLNPASKSLDTGFRCASGQ